MLWVLPFILSVPVPEVPVLVEDKPVMEARIDFQLATRIAAGIAGAVVGGAVGGIIGFSLGVTIGEMLKPTVMKAVEAIRGP